MTKVKICGLSTPEAVATAVKAGADYIGFVFAKSKRQVSLEQAHELISKISVPVIRAIQISDGDSQVKSQAGYLLFDAPIAGSGQTFDWELLADKQIEQDYFIAGGLAVDNVAEAKETFHPYALDVSSGVETDGYKDLKKIKAFIERVKA